MAQSSHTVVGVFHDYETAQDAVEDLVEHGIPKAAIRVESNRAAAASSEGRRGSEQDGGFFHWLFGSGQDDSEERGRYVEAVGHGSAVVSVTAPPEALDQAADILNEHGAIDVDQHAAADRGAAAGTTAGGGRQAIPVVEEELQVGKRVMRRGGVRIYSRVIDEPVEEQVTLQEEHVRVERRPVDRPISPAEAARLRDQSVEMEETAEEPVVSKRARVKEEVVVGKETTQRTEKVRDKVRRTEVDVEHVGSQAGTPRDWSAYREDFHDDYDRNHAAAGAEWATMEPAYQYGSRMADDPRYRGKSWPQVEADMRASYQREHPDSTWDSVKDAVRYGWEKVSGQR